MDKFEQQVLELLEDWASDTLNITGLGSCDALLDLLEELRTRGRGGKAWQGVYGSSGPPISAGFSYNHPRHSHWPIIGVLGLIVLYLVLIA